MNDDLREAPTADPLRRHDYTGALLFGYYGGGNFGDELLLAVLADRLHRNGFQDLRYVYLDAPMHELLGHDLPAEPVIGASTMLTALRRSRAVVVGGGGHWGMDANRSVLLLGVLLCAARILGRKPVYLLGVGYYGSANRTGRVAAWLAGKAATAIYARDPESFAHFARISDTTVLDSDLAMRLDVDALDVQAGAAVADELGLAADDAATVVAVRRFREDRGAAYLNAVQELCAARPGHTFVVTLLEPRSVDAAGWAWVNDLAARLPNVRPYDLHVDPLAFAAFLRRQRSGTDLIAPQFHAQLVAHLVGMRHFPVSYDNKVTQLLAGLGVENVIDIDDVTGAALAEFVDRPLDPSTPQHRQHAAAGAPR